MTTTVLPGTYRFDITVTYPTAINLPRTVRDVPWHLAMAGLRTGQGEITIDAPVNRTLLGLWLAAEMHTDLIDKDVTLTAFELSPVCITCA
ncbi:hypothetical protein ACFWPU_44990 [Streptomyces sp. NPDC058471]|uniref:hypothetical protein n=1 Tax=Streptomyces sp. NPDC058471 TaxID=3346516 RepID=UPI003653A2E2